MTRLNSTELAPGPQQTEDSAIPQKSHRPVRRRYLISKRVFDLVASLLILVLSVPLWLLIGLAIKLDSRGPILFTQRRVGKNGKEFVIYKFRSMSAHADPRVHQEAFKLYAAGVHMEEDEEGPRFKAARDPRVTRVGRLLRATNLDELPQVLNVIKGDMSLVGPRPAISYELQWYQEWYYQRFQALPGITGLWQIKDRFHMGLEGMIRYDVEYVERRSFALDIKIMVATALALPIHRWRKLKDSGRRAD